MVMNCDMNWHPKGIKPYYADDYVFIVNSDCLNILRELSTEGDMELEWQ